MSLFWMGFGLGMFFEALVLLTIFGVSWLRSQRPVDRRIIRQLQGERRRVH